MLAEQLQAALHDRYRIVRELDRGGMARVFIVEELALHREVVLKVLPPELIYAVSTLRFTREVALMSALQHPNILPVLSAGDAGGVPFYTMPFVRGESLRARLQRGPVPTEEAAAIVRDIARALDYAHRHGVVHRDIKPENILLSHGAAVVADFGIAKAIVASRTGPEAREAPTPTAKVDGTSLTHLGESIGTPGYMAPEQATGDPDVDHRADIYSLGVVAYEVFAGVPPFPGLRPHELIAAQFAEKPPALGDLRPTLPPALAAMIMRCLAVKAAQRPAAAAELLALVDTHVVDTPRSVRQRATAPPRTLRMTAVAGGVLLLAAAGAAWRIFRVPGFDDHRVGLAVAGDSVAALAVADFLRERASALGGATVVPIGSVSTFDAPRRVRSLARDAHTAQVIEIDARRVGDSVVVRLAVADGRTGEPARAFPLTRTTAAGLGDELTDLRERVLGAVMLITDPAFGRNALPPNMPARIEAVRALREALEAEAGVRPPATTDQMVSNLERFDRAIADDSTFVQARLWFAAAALHHLGGESLADSVIRLVLLPGVALSPYERAMLDGIQASIAGNHTNAIAAWQRAANESGGWPVRWQLAMELRDGNRLHEAIGTIERLAVVNSDFRRALPSLYHYLGDHVAELRAVGDEARRRPAVRQTLDWQQAELEALAAQFGPDSVLPRLDAVLSAPVESETSQAFLLTRVAWELAAHGGERAAPGVVERAAEWCGRRTAQELRNTVLLFDCLEAYAYAGRAPELSRAANEMLRRHPADAPTHGLLAWFAAAHSATRLADTLTAVVTNETQLRGSRGLPEWMQARVLATQRHESAAVDRLRDAFAAGAAWQFRFDLHRDPAFATLRTYPPFRALLVPSG